VNLIVDIGNTLVKCAVMAEGECVAERCGETFSVTIVDELCRAYPISKSIVSSTRGEVAGVVAALRRRIGRCLEFTPRTPVPLVNDYLTPDTLGRDRLAAAVGAAAILPGRNVLIVDFGTAVTVDFVSADGHFCGGCISPGLRSRFRALHEHTAALPLCEAPGAEPELFGRTTVRAIQSGVVQSIVFEIEGYIARMRQKIDDPCVIFTGGDAKYFAKRIKNTIFANRNPVFCGLDRILEFNVIEEHLP
jgi:type III pantothenate kinase